jgi:hypothetical protein
MYDNYEYIFEEINSSVLMMLFHKRIIVSEINIGETNLIFSIVIISTEDVNHLYDKLNTKHMTIKY